MARVKYESLRILRVALSSGQLSKSVELKIEVGGRVTTDRKRIALEIDYIIDGEGPLS